ncbi:MAG TPA: DUF1801 domain-containing protein [Gaiellaceae bacterium]|nr:DUF1801 domain-containing protein [Gaiellaceae bacterium]
MTPDEHIAGLDEPRRGQVRELHELICAMAPTLTPQVVSGMIGYGSYHYVYASGREGEWPILAIASRKAYISLYACAATDGLYVAEEYRERLPKAVIGKSCVRFKRLDDLDRDVLAELIRRTAAGPYLM